MIDPRVRIAAIAIVVLAGIAIAVAIARPRSIASPSRTIAASGVEGKPRTKAAKPKGGGAIAPGTQVADASAGSESRTDSGTKPKTTKKGKKKPGAAATPEAGTPGSGAAAAGILPGAGGAPKLGATSAPGAKPSAGSEAASGDVASKGTEGTEEGGGAAGGVEPTATPSEELGTGVVGGRVLRGEDAIPGARLQLTPDSGEVQFANSLDDGTYTFPPVSAGSYTLTLLAPPSPSAVRRFTLQAGAERLSEDFVIPSIPPVRGNVVNDATGEGVPAATLTVTTGVTGVGVFYGNSDGSFELPPLEPGNYSVSAVASGFQNGEAAFEVTENGAASDVEIRLHPSAAQVQGVVRGPDGTPVGGAQVSLFRVGASFDDPYAAVPWQRTDPGGSFSFGSIPAGKGPFRPAAYAQGFVAAYGPAIDPETAKQAAGDVTLSGGQSLRGRIVNAAKEPVPNATIQIMTGFASSTPIMQRFNVPYPRVESAEDGTFTIAAVEEGPTSIQVSASDYTTKLLDVNVSGATAAMGDVVIDSNEEPAAGKIFGVVVDDRGQGILTNVTASCLSCEGSQAVGVQSDSGGNFVFEDLPAGSYRIDLNGSALYGSLWMPLTQRAEQFPAGGPAVVLSYDLSHKARVTLLDVAGRPATRFTVTADVTDTFGDGQYSHQSYRTTLETSNGEATLEHLLPGNAKFTFTVGSGVKEVTGEIPSAGDLDLGTITVGAGGNAIGVVVAQGSNAALSGVTVQAVAPEGSSADNPLLTVDFSQVTSADGRFSIQGLPDGAFDLAFRGAGRASTRRTGFTSTAGEQTDTGTTTLAAGAILSGHVTDAQTGASISGIAFQCAGVQFFADAGGNFRTDTLPAGNFTLHAFQYPGNDYEPHSADISLVAGQELRHDFKMTKR